ncbi:hypothetical protein GPECTOR_139g676 [Gonium pectorale]|uniref:WW domain-containing protein n=1 Tax=Gonium pectorale TaxID=33097 RepID=A0A150FZM9_GONPE|nr:hypothetical protein GPECTOR_139g676 [Gonium pectorale]|eukprot:KXZ42520.1 hypothetical protein GPECTOR_139g676 [Gonium pectorale]
MGLRGPLLLAAAVLLFSCCLAQEAAEAQFKSQYTKFKDVPGIKKGEDGQRYIEVGEGEEAERWLVVKHEESKMLFFYNQAADQAIWHDPRGPAPKSEAESIDIQVPMTPPPPKASGITVALVAMLPILLFAGGTAARVAYLQMYYPELLWPQKERRDRRKAAGGKTKPQKQRGKMNQDGKGGRSANS